VIDIQSTDWFVLRHPFGMVMREPGIDSSPPKV